MENPSRIGSPRFLSEGEKGFLYDVTLDNITVLMSGGMRLAVLLL